MSTCNRLIDGPKPRSCAQCGLGPCTQPEKPATAAPTTPAEYTSALIIDRPGETLPPPRRYELVEKLLAHGSNAHAREPHDVTLAWSNELRALQERLDHQRSQYVTRLIIDHRPGQAADDANAATITEKAIARVQKHVATLIDMVRNPGTYMLRSMVGSLDSQARQANRAIDDLLAADRIANDP